MARGARRISRPRKPSQNPSVKGLLKPTVDAIRKNGGVAANREIFDIVAMDLQLPLSALDEVYDGTNQSVLGKRLAWARTILKKWGIIVNIDRGVWAFPDKLSDKEIEELLQKLLIDEEVPEEFSEG